MTAVSRGIARSIRIISVVGVAHMTSHVYQFSLPPLFPLLREELGTSYTELGLLLAAFSLASSLCQVPVGFFVDRIGGRGVLVGGLALQAVAIGLVGVAGTYPALFVLFLLAGLAHSVYHPADYSILSGRVEHGSLGRAFTLHSFAGNIGTAATPLMMVGLTALWGWRAAFLAIGAVGVAIAALVWTESARPDSGMVAQSSSPKAKPRSQYGVREGLALLLSPTMLLCFAFYVVLASSFSGLRAYSASALVEMNGIDLATANGAVTALIVGIAAGMLAGGVVADRYGPRTVTAAFSLLASSGILLLIGGVSMPIGLLVLGLASAGFLRGLVQGTRDLVVFAATPDGQYGKTFAFVTSGGHLGQAIMPLVFGWALDRGEPALIFTVAAGLSLLALVTFVSVRRSTAG
jgi:predicted MFS family arabinose efflux permease